MDPWRLILSGKGAAAYNMAVEEAVVQCCAQSLDIVLQPVGLSDSELRLADQLAERKYASSDWTFRRFESVDNGMLSCYTGEATWRGERCHA